MDNDIWHRIWASDRQGFHERHPNAFLEKYVHLLPERARILVPLCGRSYDLPFLAAAGHTVIGIELVEDAARGFFEEQGLTPREYRIDDQLCLEAGNITIHVGDVLAMTSQRTGPVDAIYDRAAIVALAPQTRPAYAQKLRELLAPGGPILTITFADPDRTSGPPFSVDLPELAHAYPGSHIDVLQTQAGTRKANEAPSTQNMAQKAFWIVP